MNKQHLSIEIKYDLSHWRYGISIEDIRRDLDALEKMGATDIDIDLENEWDSYSINISACQKREETDNEYAERLAYEKERIANNKRLEEQMLYEQYKRLKQKFEPEL